MPFFSVIVPVCNDWRALDKCLQSLSQQANAPEFEVVVVDDGSDNFAPRFIRQWESVYPLRIVRSPDTGIAAARNYGLRISRGTILVFTDADCRLEQNCLAELSQAISHSGYGWFQLHLTGDRSSLVGQTEDLRLTMLQNHLLDASGCLRYLNTSGFAVRRSELRIDEDLFDPAAIRAEDTLLLATLMRKRQAPFFVRGATVEHAIPRSLLKRLRKDALSAYLETYAFAKISAMGVRVRMTNRARCQMLRAMWTSHARLSACSLLLIRQLLRRAVTSMCSLSQQRAQLFVCNAGTAGFDQGGKAQSVTT
jgi:glycosyltransferase involved in cell wall biosynthesis